MFQNTVSLHVIASFCILLSYEHFWMLALPLAVLQWIGSLATFQGCHESTNRLVTLRLQVKKPIEGTKLWLVGDGVPVVGCTQNQLQDTWRKDGFSTQANSYFLRVWRCGHGRLESWHNKGPYILKFCSWKKQTEAGLNFSNGMCLFSNISRNPPSDSVTIG